MTQMQKLKKLLFDFLRFGLFTFGGGMSIVAQMQQKYVQEEQCISSEDILDLTSVAKSLPGVMITNVAMLFGCQQAGLAGGFAAVFAMSLPPMAILMLITTCYTAFRSNYWVAAAMGGMQAAVVPIILSAAVGLMKGSIKYPPCVLITLVCFCLFVFAEVSTVVLIVIGVIGGFLIGDWYERKEAKIHGAS